MVVVWHTGFRDEKLKSLVEGVVAAEVVAEEADKKLKSRVEVEEDGGPGSNAAAGGAE